MFPDFFITLYTSYLSLADSSILVSDNTLLLLLFNSVFERRLYTLSSDSKMLARPSLIS